MTLRTLLRRASRHDDGASGVEYAMLIGGIAAVILATVAYLGQTVNSLYTKVSLP